MTWHIHTGDTLAILPTLDAGSVHTCVTSPPYWGLRDYGHDGQIGLEQTPEEYTARMVEVFREVRRVLRDDGTVWLNLGDSYASDTKGSGGPPGKTLGQRADGSMSISDDNRERTGKRAKFDVIHCDHGLKPKDLVGIPWRVAFALQAAGWYLRSDCIWHKPNPMPESVTDRPTKGHEYMFLLAKSARYWYDAGAIAESADTAGESRITVDHGNGGYQAAAMGRKPSGNQVPGTLVTRKDTRNRRTVWTVATQPYPGAHFAVMPPALVEPCILAGCPEGGTVLDPFAGAGTVGLVASRLQRSFVGVELNPEYAEMARRRIHDDAPLFGGDV